jgi:NTE family protein
MNTPSEYKMSSKNKIAIVLSGGSMHGFAEIGALKVIQKLGIKPDLIVGCSVGALIGAFLSAEKSMDELEKSLLKENIISFIQPTLGKGGLIRPEKIVRFVIKNSGASSFEQLKTKLIVNSVT